MNDKNIIRSSVLASGLNVYSSWSEGIHEIDDTMSFEFIVYSNNRYIYVSSKGSFEWNPLKDRNSLSVLIRKMTLAGLGDRLESVLSGKTGSKTIDALTCEPRLILEGIILVLEDNNVQKYEYEKE